MANDGDSGLPAGGGNRSLEELRISQTILGRKLDSISNDLRRASDTLRVVTENLRIRENRAPPVRRAYVSPMGARGQRRARRHVQPAPPEFSESDEGGIPNRRRYDEDSSSDEEVEQWILGQPRFAAQPRYHYHPPPSLSSSPYHCHHLYNQHHDHDQILHPTPHIHHYQKSHHCDQHPNPTFNPHTRSRKPNQFRDHHRSFNPTCDTQSTKTPHHRDQTVDPTPQFRETHKNPKPKIHSHSPNQFSTCDTKSISINLLGDQPIDPTPLFENTPENQFQINKTQEESKAERLMCTFSLEEEELLNSIDQLQQSDDESMAAETQKISAELSAIDVYHLDTTISVQQQQAEPGSNTFVELQRQGIEPNKFTFSSLIKGCANQAALDQGIQLHAQVIRFNYDKNPFVSSILVDVYGKCGLLDDSIRVFDDIDDPTEIGHYEIYGAGIDSDSAIPDTKLSWVSSYNLLLASGSYSDISGVLGSIKLWDIWSGNVVWEIKEREDCFSDVTVSDSLSAIFKVGINTGDVFTWTAMMPGYIHNGMVDEARKTFDAMTCRNVGSWNTMITGYAQSGEITLARNLFDRSPLDTIACDIVRFAEPVNDKIVLSVLIGQIVSTLGFGFENVKTKGVRRRQWQIAWSFSACRWAIVLVPLWLWDTLRRDFSVGVYHSHKPNMGTSLHCRPTSSFPACLNRTRGRVLFEERATDVGNIYC